MTQRLEFKKFGQVDSGYAKDLIREALEPIAKLCPDVKAFVVKHYFSDVFYFDANLPRNNMTDKPEKPIAFTNFHLTRGAWKPITKEVLWAADGQYLFDGNPGAEYVSGGRFTGIHESDIIANGNFNWSVWRKESLSGKYSAQYAHHEYYERRKAPSAPNRQDEHRDQELSASDVFFGAIDAVRLYNAWTSGTSGNTSVKQDDGATSSQSTCRARAEKRVVWCGSGLSNCDSVGCTYEVSCNYGAGKCRKYTTMSTPYGFYCDSQNTNNTNSNKEELIADICSGN